MIAIAEISPPITFGRPVSAERRRLTTGVANFITGFLSQDTRRPDIGRTLGSIPGSLALRDRLGTETAESRSPLGPPRSLEFAGVTLVFVGTTGNAGQGVAADP